MHLFQAEPDTDDSEPGLELRHEVEKITAEASLFSENFARKEDYIKKMQTLTGNMSMDRMNRMRMNYEKIVKKYNKDRKNGFKDIQLAWEGTCPGCKNCTGDERTLEPKHTTESMDCTLEAISIGVCSRGIVRLYEELLTIQAENKAVD